jgi:hypothetical protein
MFIIADIMGRHAILKRDNLRGEPLERKRCARVGRYSFGISMFRFMGTIICIEMNNFHKIPSTVLENALIGTSDLFNRHIIEHVCFLQRMSLDIT